jgi:hypothetical protein
LARKSICKFCGAGLSGWSLLSFLDPKMTQFSGKTSPVVIRHPAPTMQPLLNSVARPTYD